MGDAGPYFVPLVTLSSVGWRGHPLTRVSINCLPSAPRRIVLCCVVGRRDVVGGILNVLHLCTCFFSCKEND